MNAHSLRPRRTLRLTRSQQLVSPTLGLTPTLNKQNIKNNVNGADRLQQPDSTETGADHSVHQSGGTPVFLTREPR
jgi:hypothetical protein